MKAKVLTLNCWGIPWSIPTISSPDRQVRFTAIGEFLATSKYDFVFLQEVWDDKDYTYLTQVLATSMPHSYYFKTGVIGSGTCVFSVSPIEGVMHHIFSVNGYHHQVWRGDGLAGAGVGAVQVNHAGKNLLLCVTHFHAEYYGEFVLDRAVQAWEARNFLKMMTGDKYDLLIMAGDFNTLPGQLPYRILTNYLKDCWQGQYKVTFGNPGNRYSAQEEPETLDYIFVRGGPTVRTRIQGTCLPLPPVIPGTGISYSDHEAVQTEISTEDIDSTEEKETTNDDTNSMDDLAELTLAVKTDLVKTVAYQDEYFAISVVTIFFIIFFQHWLLNTILAFLCSFCIFLAAGSMQSRKVALQNILQQIEQESRSHNSHEVTT